MVRSLRLVRPSVEMVEAVLDEIEARGLHSPVEAAADLTRLACHLRTLPPRGAGLYRRLLEAARPHYEGRLWLLADEVGISRGRLCQLTGRRAA